MINLFWIIIALIFALHGQKLISFMTEYDNTPCIFAWMAGFIDGEGCLTISKQIRKDRPSPAWRPLITIANTNKDSLELFQKTYGGTLRFNKEKRRSPTGVKWSDSWTWYCPQSAITKLLGDIKPYLIVKKLQADILIEFCKHLKTRNRQKGGRYKNGKFIGSKPISEASAKYRDMARNKIQNLNSGKRFKVIQDV